MDTSQTWFIAGDSQDLGLALTQQLLAGGHRVAATSRRLDTLTQTVSAATAAFLPLQTDLVDEARYAAAVLRIDYDRQPHHTDLSAPRQPAAAPQGNIGNYRPLPPPTGQPTAAWARAPHRMAATYGNSTQNHNPMEAFAANGVFALEVALDEMAYEAGLDPVELRLRSYADHSGLDRKPFSSRSLRACYEQGAARFGRGHGRRRLGSAASPQRPRHAHGRWPAVGFQRHKRGYGTGTVMTQVAAETLGLPLAAVTFRQGDTTLPNAPLQGASWTAALVWGISMALMEATVMDHHFGRFMNHSLAEYHVPVNADIPDLDVLFVAEKDTVVNPLGAKGVGEIGLLGVVSAICNAVYHDTGKRIRELSITPEKLLV